MTDICLPIEAQAEDSIRRWLQYDHRATAAYWAGGNGDRPDTCSILDYLYCAWMLDARDLIDDAGVNRFHEELIIFRWNDCLESKTVHVHQMAYLLGGVNLLCQWGFQKKGLISELNIPVDRLLDHSTALPVWPTKFNYHPWRASHWIGGTLAILYNLVLAGDPRCDRATWDNVVNSIDEHLITDKTGLLRLGRNGLMKAAFNAVYRIRHLPLYGEIGGIVHLHWVYETSDHRILAPAALLTVCKDALSSRNPFLEGHPYCLDFDLVSVMKMVLAQNPQLASTIPYADIAAYRDDIIDYHKNLADKKSYSLHALPGAMAAVRECNEILRFQNDSPPEPLRHQDNLINIALWL